LYSFFLFLLAASSLTTFDPRGSSPDAGHKIFDHKMNRRFGYSICGEAGVPDTRAFRVVG
jgi:hypothetical protein